MSCEKSCSQGTCGCSCHTKSDYEEHECSHEHHQKHHDYADELLELADDAWMEVLMDKIKEEILAHSGDHLTQLAKLVTTTNHERWKDKLAQKYNCEHFREELRQLMDKQHPK